jgi:nickel/cobalt transporter (NicO) family protein
MDVLFNVQQWIYAAVGGHLNAFAASHDWAALLAIMPLGVMFGAIHALTPGHSKTLLASYLVGSRLALLRSLSVSSALAMTHVLSSVLIALFAAHLITRTLVGAGRAPVLEDVSRGILVLVGIWFVVRALRGRAHHAKQEGVAVGVAAGLIPCPLTLFVMVLALSKDIAAAGVAFAGAMMLGIGLTLGAVAALAVIGRNTFAIMLTRYGASIAAVARGLDGVAGVLLIAFGLREMLR